MSLEIVTYSPTGQLWREMERQWSISEESLPQPQECTQSWWGRKILEDEVVITGNSWPLLFWSISSKISFWVQAKSLIILVWKLALDIPPKSEKLKRNLDTKKSLVSDLLEKNSGPRNELVFGRQKVNESDPTKNL